MSQRHAEVDLKIENSTQRTVVACLQRIVLTRKLTKYARCIIIHQDTHKNNKKNVDKNTTVWAKSYNRMILNNKINVVVIYSKMHE